ncbi:putative protein phosphatase 2C [Neospora caninum Liverpool]|uniref:Protein phosphatase 2C, putative n=1 Tax=Neospora caninum (strain Liverpool) TaxID=572307 RepID=F0VFF1_NEOCL|nr:putative protein phosphatase 2C [Neospora caninum Liverpool]CBZ52445.1 putative protein phosphatase 2C [Neospora caninum Liverpool]CEL66419.1 TPA: protein phosphatase 2C, putative [Neospora caninum Liverpool]|eukprot:XP_003882477.1 putative protein phosphatase 2C [Neospora caninum Liverpool]
MEREEQVSEQRRKRSSSSPPFSSPVSAPVVLSRRTSIASFLPRCCLLLLFYVFYTGESQGSPLSLSLLFPEAAQSDTGKDPQHGSSVEATQDTTQEGQSTSGPGGDDESSSDDDSSSAESGENDEGEEDDDGDDPDDVDTPDFDAPSPEPPRTPWENGSTARDREATLRRNRGSPVPRDRDVPVPPDGHDPAPQEGTDPGPEDRDGPVPRDRSLHKPAEGREGEKARREEREGRSGGSSGAPRSFPPHRLATSSHGSALPRSADYKGSGASPRDADGPSGGRVATGGGAGTAGRRGGTRSGAGTSGSGGRGGVRASHVGGARDATTQDGARLRETTRRSAKPRPQSTDRPPRVANVKENSSGGGRSMGRGAGDEGQETAGSLRNQLRGFASKLIGGGSSRGDKYEDDEEEDMYDGRDEQEKVIVSYAEAFTVTAAGTMVGRRPTDEDALLVNAILPHMPNVRVKAIFDGHGGDEVARYLADNALTYLSHLTSLRAQDIQAACLAMDDAVRRVVWKDAPDAGATGIIAFIEKVVSPVEVNVVGREIVRDDGDPTRPFVPLLEQLQLDALAEGDTYTAMSLGRAELGSSEGRRSRQKKRRRRRAKKITLGAGEAVFRVVVANVGDSRAVLLHQDGSFTPLSRDQKPEQETERLRVEAAGGRVVFGDVPRVDNMLAVARSYGDFYMKDNPRLPADKQKVIAVPDIRMFYATPKDLLLLTCDVPLSPALSLPCSPPGVFEPLPMTYKNVAAVVHQTPVGGSVRGRMKRAVTNLLDAAYETGSNDNISAMLTAFTPKGRFSSHTTLGYTIFTGDGEIIQQGHERQENTRMDPDKVKKNVSLY